MDGNNNRVLVYASLTFFLLLPPANGWASNVGVLGVARVVRKLSRASFKKPSVLRGLVSASQAASNLCPNSHQELAVASVICRWLHLAFEVAQAVSPNCVSRSVGPSSHLLIFLQRKTPLQPPKLFCSTNA